MEGAMAEAEVAVQGAALELARSAALDQQVASERTMMRSVVHGIFIALPFTIAFTIGLLAIAISDKATWYIWVGLGTGIGTYAAVFFGSVAGVMLTAHRLDEPGDRDEPGEEDEQATDST
jgi:hypothetical protein